jgi:phosphoribosylanthranilate isomerase
MKVKFCGFTRIEDIKFALSINVDYIGLVLFPKSPRFVTIENLETITKTIKDAPLVGVFVNEDIEKVKEMYLRYNFKLVQLHGDETNEYVEELVRKGIKVIKAFRVKDHSALEKINETPTELVLLDAFKEGEYGGTGKRIDEEVLNYILNSAKNKKIFLSGGLNKDNIEEVLKKFGQKIYGIDLSSGIEVSPGIKDHRLMEEIITKVNRFKQLQA